MTRHSIALFLMLLAYAHADTLTLRNGTNVTGSWVGVDARQIVFQVNNQLQTYARSDVSKVTFSPPAAPALGQTIEQVVAALGQPSTIMDLGAKKIYVYADQKITFEDGKVSSISK